MNCCARQPAVGAKDLLKQLGVPQALKKVMQTPRFANRRAQLAAEWEARNKTNGGSALVVGKASAAKLTRRGKAKAGSSLPPEVEKEIEEQALSEVRCPVSCCGCVLL
jgi:hypothetical protein